jgi:hypothetical protein
MSTRLSVSIAGWLPVSACRPCRPATEALRGQHEGLGVFLLILAAAQDRNDFALLHLAECQLGLEELEHFNINDLSGHLH